MLLCALSPRAPAEFNENMCVALYETRERERSNPLLAFKAQHTYTLRYPTQPNTSTTRTYYTGSTWGSKSNNNNNVDVV